MASTVEEIYEQIARLTPAERLRLAARILDDLATSESPKRSIMELHGLGQEIWEGVDAQEYVNKLRQEWDHRP